MLKSKLESTKITVNGIDLHVKQGGPEDGDPVVFLHGFPEYWYGWRNQLAFFMERGYRVIVPDQRGYNRSEQPQDIKDYQLKLLVADVVELADQLGYESVDIISHDWGATVGWRLAETHPETVSSLTVMNVAHPGVFEGYIRTHPSQFLRSWYILWFLLPLVPELIMGMWNYYLLRKVFDWSSNDDTFSEDELDDYVSTWQKSDALRSMVNWYRASLIYAPDLDPEPELGCPVRMLWGEQDAFLNTELAEICEDRMDRVNLTLFPEATHWIHHEIPEKVNLEIEKFLSKQ